MNYVKSSKKPYFSTTHTGLGYAGPPVTRIPCLALEPRFMFDAAGVATGIEAAQEEMSQKLAEESIRSMQSPFARVTPVAPPPLVDLDGQTRDSDYDAGKVNRLMLKKGILLSRDVSIDGLGNRFELSLRGFQKGDELLLEGHDLLADGGQTVLRFGGEDWRVERSADVLTLTRIRTGNISSDKIEAILGTLTLRNGNYGAAGGERSVDVGLYTDDGSGSFLIIGRSTAKVDIDTEGAKLDLDGRDDGAWSYVRGEIEQKAFKQGLSIGSQIEVTGPAAKIVIDFAEGFKMSDRFSVNGIQLDWRQGTTVDIEVEGTAWIAERTLTGYVVKTADGRDVSTDQLETLLSTIQVGSASDVPPTGARLAYVSLVDEAENWPGNRPSLSFTVIEDLAVDLDGRTDGQDYDGGRVNARMLSHYVALGRDIFVSRGAAKVTLSLEGFDIWSNREDQLLVGDSSARVDLLAATTPVSVVVGGQEWMIIRNGDVIELTSQNNTEATAEQVTALLESLKMGTQRDNYQEVDGPRKVTVVLTDGEGRQSNSATAILVVDMKGPEIDLNGDDDTTRSYATRVNPDEFKHGVVFGMNIRVSDPASKIILRNDKATGGLRSGDLLSIAGKDLRIDTEAPVQIRFMGRLWIVENELGPDRDILTLRTADGKDASSAHVEALLATMRLGNTTETPLQGERIFMISLRDEAENMPRNQAMLSVNVVDRISSGLRTSLEEEWRLRDAPSRSLVSALGTHRVPGQ